MIMKCKCKHAGQDLLHGFENRVFNKTEKAKQGPPVFRCTVCKAEKSETVK
jgi:hypothetical protein